MSANDIVTVEKSKFSDLWKKEDWLAVWIGVVLIAIAAVLVLAVAVAILYLYLKKQLTSKQDIVLSKEDAEEGVKATINVSYDSQTVSFVYNIPPNVKDGQKFVAKNILFENKKGKKVKKNVHFKVKVM